MTQRGSPVQITGSGPLMGLTYFKRYRMEFDLGREDSPPPELPAGYRLVPWGDRLASAHAQAMHRSFRTEVDANVFPCLASSRGCQRLMEELCRRPNFLPEATWLVTYRPTSDIGWLSFDRMGNFRTSRMIASLDGDSRGVRDDDSAFEVCGTIQGIEDRGAGAIQNLGIVPAHRGRGLGERLMHLSLAGFRRLGLRKAALEVTASNEGALRLYRRLGFVKARTLYKAVEVEAFAAP